MVGLRGLEKLSHLRFNARLPVLSSVAVRLVSHGHVHIEDALPATTSQSDQSKGRVRQRGHCVGLHVEKSLLCHFKTLCWSHVLHLAQKRVHFLHKHVSALVRLALQQPDRRRLRSRTQHSQVHTAARVARMRGVCLGQARAKARDLRWRGRDGAGQAAAGGRFPEVPFHVLPACARMDNNQRDSHFARELARRPGGAHEHLGG